MSRDSSFKLYARISRSTGFTLIEVLLGVMILAIGLLGLGAVFPLVVKQQRTAQDAIVGLSTAKGAESYLRSHLGMADVSTKGGWAAISRQLYNGIKSKPLKDRLAWSEILNGSDPFYGNIGDNHTNLSGTLRFVSTSNPGSTVYIKPTDRLLPSGQSDVEPMFVWDVAPSLANSYVQRNLTDAPSNLPIRVTVFVRRIDPGIRVTSGKSLLEAISKGEVVPVAADGDGLATLDGKGVLVNGKPKYSTFKYPEADPVAYRRFNATSGAYNVLTFSKASQPELAAIRQIGQQLVDTDGNVYTVTAFPDESEKDYGYGKDMATSVVVSPGIPGSLLSNGGGLPSNFQLLCTPQIPAAVTTFVVRP